MTGASSGLGAALADGSGRPRRHRRDCAPAGPTGWTRCWPDVPDDARPTAGRGRSTCPTSTGSTGSPPAWSSELGGLDVLVNNAGIPKRRWAWDHRPDEVADVLRVNVRVAHPAHPAPCSPPSADAGGHVVFIGSVAARLAPPNEAVYAASKAGDHRLRRVPAGRPGRGRQRRSACTWSSPACWTPSCSRCPTTTRRSPTSSRCRRRRSSVPVLDALESGRDRDLRARLVRRPARR